MKTIEQRVGKIFNRDVIYCESAGTDLSWKIMPTNMEGKKAKAEIV